MRPPWPLERPLGTYGKRPRSGGRERLARDPSQPIWMLLTWPRGPDALPTPQLSREGRGWGLRPLPQSNLSFRGGDTPDYILPPHQDKGNIGAPLEGSRIQVRRGLWRAGALSVI